MAHTTLYYHIKQCYCVLLAHTTLYYHIKQCYCVLGEQHTCNQTKDEEKKQILGKNKQKLL